MLFGAITWPTDRFLNFFADVIDVVGDACKKGDHKNLGCPIEFKNGLYNDVFAVVL